MVLKLHRYFHIAFKRKRRPLMLHMPPDSLGRVSFRAIKEKRDYLGRRKSASWMYMSRLAAQKEWAFLKVRHGRVIFLPNAGAQMPLVLYFPLPGSTRISISCPTTN
jgi:hypothetical protein